MLIIGSVITNGDYATTNIELEQEIEYACFTSPQALRNIVIAPANGNHDDNRKPYENHYNLPDNPAGVGGAGAVKGSIYSFTRGDALFMVINTDADLVSQLNWMKTTANASTAKWKIVMFHKSIYAVGDHINAAVNDGTRILISAVCDQAGIDLVLQGHDHCYVRTYPMYNNAKVSETIVNGYSQNPGGTVYLQTNGGAVKQYNLATTTPEYYVAKKISGEATGPGYCAIEVTSTKLTIKFYRANDNALLDTYGIEKP